jgi:hypothetical protein
LRALVTSGGQRVVISVLDLESIDRHGSPQKSSICMGADG